MKIGENDSVHEFAKMLQASSKLDLFWFFLNFFFYDLHLQIIESISPKASVEKSSAQWAILLFVVAILRSGNLAWLGNRKMCAFSL